MTSTAGEFLTFVLSDMAQHTIQRAGGVNLSIESQSFSDQGERLISLILAGQGLAPLASIKDFARELRFAQRLSVTFRFDFTGSELDSDSGQEISALADYLRATYSSNSEVVVAGFTSSEGIASVNSVLSLKGARLVASRLEQALSGSGIQLVARGFGEISPLNCDSTIYEQRINQRVEIWVRPAE
jgi:phosphate transport system substrate-binding protein